ncbi:ligand-binding sensor domain-containing protein [Methanoregula sp.]|uniref:ligand-binding sensor domain-containing protein n=1 Tax=Methanoregula sp. TaxID=2052170 RepID=UPI002C997BE9|nr:two-component regulator propeller domain-containing protein [Methanoregula sp.]HVP96154.1 two-component regulator propeller domain-containing protein [Methanoregula sp.]
MALPTRSDCIFFVLFILVLMPVSAAADQNTTTGSGQQQETGQIFLFRPASDSIPSTQVNAIINGLDGSVLVGTPLGLSTFDGSWSTRHINRNNLSSGLLDNFVTALAYDGEGNLWIGYAGGIQVYNGHDYQLIADQQLLKSLQIRAFQRWNDEMWIATGNSGLSRYSQDTWTWYAPNSPGGPGFYEADSMALDPVSGTLLVGTRDEGLWAVTSPDTTARFTELQSPYDTFGLLGQVRQDPLGGVYFFNTTEVAHYSPASGFIPVLSGNDFYGGPYAINDVAAGPGGAVYVATENGIYVWKNGAVTRHLGTFEGFGTNVHNVRMVFLDAKGRLWFSTLDIVGYYTGDEPAASLIAVETVTPTPVPTPGPVNATPVVTLSGTTLPQNPSFIDSISGFFTGLLHLGH